MSTPQIDLPGPLPSLTAGYVVAAADLNTIVDNVNYLGSKPIVNVVTTSGGTAISTSPNTTSISWGATKFDTVGMWSSSAPTFLTVQVNGWYKVRYSIVVAGTGGNACNGYMSQVSGPSPGNFLGSGVEIKGTLPDCALGASGLWPFYLYVGDQLQLWVDSNTTGQTTAVGIADSELSMEWVSF